MLGLVYRFPATVEVLSKVLPLAAVVVLSVVAANLVAPFVLAALAVVLGAVFAVVATVVGVLVAVAAILWHAVTFAATMALWAGVLAAVLRLATWARRWDWRLIGAIAKGLVLFTVLAGCVVGAVLVAPAVLATGGVMVGSIVALRMM